MVAFVIILGGCGGSSKTTPIPTPTPTPTPAAPVFTTTLFLGDSLTAGFQNGSLLDTQQPNGWAPLVAKQAGFTIQLPLIIYPGAPAVLHLVSVGPPAVVAKADGLTIGRDNPTVQPTDLAVPGHYVNDVLNTAPVPTPTSSAAEDAITALVLGFPGFQNGQLLSQAQWAKQLNPTTIFLWAGNNDALVAVNAGPSAMTPVPTFTTQFTALIQYLKANTKATLIVANIPDVTKVAALTPGSVLQTELGLTQMQLTTLGIDPTDLVNTKGVTQIPLILNGSQPGPITQTYKLTTAQVTTVQQTVTQYNQVIAAQASASGATLIDVYTALNALRASPPTINGQVMGFGFLGGFFSLDGVHPTNTGYGAVANIIIDGMNSAFKTTIPDVALGPIAAADPYWPPNVTPNPSGMPVYMPAEAGAATEWMMNVRPQP